MLYYYNNKLDHGTGQRVPRRSLDFARGFPYCNMRTLIPSTATRSSDPEWKYSAVARSRESSTPLTYKYIGLRLVCEHMYVLYKFNQIIFPKHQSSFTCNLRDKNISL